MRTNDHSLRFPLAFPYSNRSSKNCGSGNDKYNIPDKPMNTAAKTYTLIKMIEAMSHLTLFTCSERVGRGRIRYGVTKLGGRVT